MKATRRRNSDVPAPASMSATRACPADGSSSPPRMRTSVDLPAPFGPMMQAISPDATVKDTPASASQRPPVQPPAQKLAQPGRRIERLAQLLDDDRRRGAHCAIGLPPRWYFTTAALCSATVFEK